MEHLVMFSGGLGSFYTARHLVNEENLTPTLLFADTRMEDPDLYRFLDDAARLLKLPLVKIQEGRTPWQVFRDVKFIGNTRVDPCSMHLKRQFIDRWVEEHYTPTTVTVNVGIDMSEAHRIHRLAPRKLPWKYRAPLVEAGVLLPPIKTRLQQLRTWGIEPPRLYAMGFQHNNCGGFCVKAGLAQFKLLLEKLPQRYDYHVRQEQKTRAAVPNARPFLRKTIDGTLRYVWLEDYRNWLQNGGELTTDERFDIGGCGCALEDAE